MKIEVKIEKRYAFMILGSLIVIAGLIGVIAYGTNNPPVFGHSAGELDVTIGGNTYTLQQAIDQNLFGGSVEVAQAFRKDGQSGDTGTTSVKRPIFTLQGPSNAFVAVNDVSAASNSFWKGTSYDNKLDGIACAPGWKLAGCWESTYTNPSDDIIPYVNGCVTNDFDDSDTANIEMSIICVK